MGSISRRSFLSTTGRMGVAAAASGFFVSESAAQVADSKYEAAFRALDAYVERYMREMNSPGMTLALSDRHETVRVTTYGFSNLGTKGRVTPEHLFHIGSITKSFAAFVLLQLADEKKVELDRPIMQYLPWLPFKEQWPVTVHHLLAHTSGLPSRGPLFLCDLTQKYEQGFKPGTAFHYCNMGYDALGHLIEKLDGVPWQESVSNRILRPLGMTATSPTITNRIRSRTVGNYSIFMDDLPYPRQGTLASAANFMFEAASGSIASTPADMARYMSAILNGGKGIASPEGFKRFSTPYILAEEFGPKVQYGYGIAVDSLDGNKVLRHTGGMVSFMSAMQLDVDAGVGAFASINAQQGYRPNPVAQYALKLMRAANESRLLPQAPEPDDPAKIKNAADYVGEYKTETGKSLTVTASGETLHATMGSNVYDMQMAFPDAFVLLPSGAGLSSDEIDRPHFLLTFGRADEKDPKSVVVEAAFGSEAYYSNKYAGQRSFTIKAGYEKLTGHYRNDDPWIGSTRVVLRKGKLWLDGIGPLEESKSDPMLFHLRDEPASPEVLRFMHIVDGHARMIKISGDTLWRLEAL
jgi:CubicO group peptidase (beta-lactamase class C family)